MCGIAGIVSARLGEAAPQAVRGMLDAMRHRGPDGDGLWSSGPAHLGHRRLSIVDLEGGKQPLCNEDGTIWISFNGEIYNFPELRPELEARGHRFKTRCDTEAIVHAYEEWGAECVKHLRGMFAFAICDTAKRTLFLARDHFGIKPLYWGRQGGILAFASELRSLRRVPGWRWDLDVRAVDDYLRLQYIPAPRSVFRDVFKLAPGHAMSVSLDSLEGEPVLYWDPVFAPDPAKNAAQWEESLDAALEESVRAHLMSDVPFGAFLSGGVDSSAVVAYMSRVMDRPVQTYCIGFEEAEFDERQHAALAAARWKTDHRVEVVKLDALSLLPTLAEHYGEPFGDSSAIPTWHVCKLAASHVKMALSGDGGDEAFAGYGSHMAWMDWLAYRDIKELKRAALQAGAFVSAADKEKRAPSLDRWMRYIEYIGDEARSLLWREEWRTQASGPCDAFEREYAAARSLAPLSQVQRMDARTYLPNDILMKVDVASMLHSLEVRTPLVDLRVWEAALRVPPALLAAKGADGGFSGKLLLKKVMERYYPPEFLHRKKQGFALPIQRWFSPGGEHRAAVEERLLGTDSPLREWFEPDGVQAVCDQGAMGQVWVLLFLDQWLRQEKDHAASSSVENSVVVSDTTSESQEEKQCALADKRVTIGVGAPARIAMFYDARGWAWWNRIRAVRRFAAPRFQIDALKIGSFHGDSYDLATVFDADFVPRLLHLPLHKRVGGCSCGKPSYMDAANMCLKENFVSGILVNCKLNHDHALDFSRSFLCQNGVDEELFCPAPERAQEFCGCWVGFSGSVGEKGTELIAEASRRTGTNILTLDRNAMNQGESGLLTPVQVRDYLYHPASFYVCMSRYEATPNPGLEALACGVPVISTRVGNMVELIRDGYNGFLIDRTAEALAEAIEKLRASDLSALRRNARDSILNGWTWRQQVKKYEHAFDQLLARGKG